MRGQRQLRRGAVHQRRHDRQIVVQNDERAPPKKVGATGEDPLAEAPTEAPSGQQRLEVDTTGEELRGGDGADTLHARNVVRGVAHERTEVRPLGGGDTVPAEDIAGRGGEGGDDIIALGGGLLHPWHVYQIECALHVVQRRDGAVVSRPTVRLVRALGVGARFGAVLAVEDDEELVAGCVGPLGLAQQCQESEDPGQVAGTIARRDPGGEPEMTAVQQMMAVDQQ